jgi:cell division protein ZipA
MEASTLRWIIVVVGLIVLAAIFLFGNPDKKRKPPASRRKAAVTTERREPTLETVPDTQQHESESSLEGQGELAIDDKADAAQAKPAKPRKPAAPPPDKIITLFLMARDNHHIAGAEILDTALKTGMEFGEMNIFHRYMEGSGKTIFSMANAAKPGVFDKEKWNTFETNGLAVFITLPAPMLALDAWDIYLASVRRMAEILNTELHDGNHQPFTRQSEAKIREEMRLYDRGQARKSLGEL